MNKMELEITFTLEHVLSLKDHHLSNHEIQTLQWQYCKFSYEKPVHKDCDDIFVEKYKIVVVFYWKWPPPPI